MDLSDDVGSIVNLIELSVIKDNILPWNSS
jgi:hypothetical protein